MIVVRGVPAAVLAGFVLLGGGCAERASWVRVAVESSPSFARLHASTDHAAWMQDSAEGNCATVAIGEDVGTHFTRRATLRVSREGPVERLSVREDGEEVWMEDR